MKYFHRNFHYNIHTISNDSLNPKQSNGDSNLPNFIQFKMYGNCRTTLFEDAIRKNLNVRSARANVI